VHHRRERKQPRGQENQAEPLRLQHLRTFGGQRQTWCHGDDEHLIYVASLGSVNKQTASLAPGASDGDDIHPYLSSRGPAHMQKASLA